MTLLFFGVLSELIGEGPIELGFDGPATVGDLRARVQRGHEEAADHVARCMVAVNREYVADDRALADGDEVAFLPPVSGG